MCVSDCVKQRSEERFENSRTVKVTEGDDEFVKTKRETKLKIIFWLLCYVTLPIPSIHNILQYSLNKENINVTYITLRPRAAHLRCTF